MNDPRRLIEGSGSPLVTELLEAGRVEEPSPELVARFARSAALGIATAVAVERAASVGAELGASNATAGGAATVGSGMTAGGTTAGGMTAGGMTAGGMTAGGMTAGGAATKAAAGSVLMKAGAGGALLKGGAASGAIAKWLGIGIAGLAAAAGTPKALDWIEHRSSSRPAALPAAIDMPPAGHAEPRGSSARPAAPPAAAGHAEPSGSSARPAAPPAAAGHAEPGGSSAMPAAPPAAIDTPPARHAEPGGSSARPAAPPAGIHTPPGHAEPPRPETPPLTPRSSAAPRTAPLAPLAPPAPPTAARRQRTKPPLEKPPATNERAAVTRADNTLGAELAMVDRARAALARGDARETLDDLTAYERTFPRSQLALEVWMLRMEAYVRLGDRPRARALADRILARPISPLHESRARAVLEGTATSR